MNRPDEPAYEEFDAAYWEDWYRSGIGAGKHDPSPSLVGATGALRPGRALDAGCGVGGDALWLAAHGWQVTAVDVSATALDHGRQAASSASPAFAERLEWVRGDLTPWEPRQTFDLVSSHYVHVPGPPEALFRSLASWVAPGGTLLVVGHDAGHGHASSHSHGSGHAHPAGAQVRAEQGLSGLVEDHWDIVVAEPRIHTMQRPDGNGPSRCTTSSFTHDGGQARRLDVARAALSVRQLEPGDAGDEAQEQHSDDGRWLVAGPHGARGSERRSDADPPTRRRRCRSAGPHGLREPDHAGGDGDREDQRRETPSPDPPHCTRVRTGAANSVNSSTPSRRPRAAGTSSCRRPATAACFSVAQRELQLPASSQPAQP